ncbi:MAG: riboflavin kinase / FMN adenylyltransferase [Chloroflexi bacterium]|jgi:riboflavin kinase/FMN adenylyltransferase|nr:MAG: riboflavin kinase / FMN adenylyltransferase [Chloroflexota bacterium]
MGLSQELNIEKDLRDSFITIGVFDGVHLGHKHLATKLIESAIKNRKSSGIITFKNHPAAVINPRFQPDFLTSFETKLDLLKDTGVDFVSAITFDQKIADLTAKDFLRLLKNRLGMKGLVVGPDFQMGKNREADTVKLATLGSELGFVLEVVDVQTKGKNQVRSTMIRNLISNGNVKNASVMLGRKFSLEGSVITGMKRGKSLGFPTANLKINNDIARPSNGIYATVATISGVRYPAATSVGTNPTFGGKEQTVETYILDFDKNIYGQSLSISFFEKLRNEITFNGVDNLIAQMESDVSEVRKLTKSGELQ